MGQIFISSLKRLFFETFVSIDFLCLKERILSFAKKLSKNHVEPYKMFPDIILVRQDEKKIGHKIHFIGKITFFLKSLFLQQPLRSERIDLITSKLNAKIPHGALKIVPWVLSYSITRGKWVNFFSLERLPSFLKNLYFQQPLRSWKFPPIFYTVLVRIACGLL